MHPREKPRKESVAPAAPKSINRHFKNEGRWMIWFLIGAPIILLLGAFLFGPSLLTLAGR
jgi:hypothetical protein